MNQPGKVANPARGQLDREINISLCPFAPENLISRDGFGRPVSRHPSYSPHSGSRAESGAFSRGIPPDFRGGGHIFIPPYAIIGSRNCIPMASTAESSPTQGQ